MTLIEKIKKLVWYNSPSKLKEILLEISGSTFNPSEHDLDEFLNESDNTFVRNSSLSYSKDETLTGGTWIDGKPIYRKTKVFSGSELVSDGEINLTVSFPNMETITKNPDVFTDWTTNNGLKMAGILFQDVMYIIYSDVLSTREPFSLNAFNTSVFDSITLTLEYTKTTD